MTQATISLWECNTHSGVMTLENLVGLALKVSVKSIATCSMQAMMVARPGVDEGNNPE